MYHRVGQVEASAPTITRALTVSPEAFASEMRWIVQHGFHAITQQELFRALEFGAPLPAKPMMITFDDGYRDVLWNAAPVLVRLHLPATAYVITGRVSGTDSSFLTWPELHRLERLGVEIGSHTVHHVELPALGSVAAFNELIVSRRELERHLGHPVQWFAYPAGAVDAAVLPLVRRAGYVLAVTTRTGSEQDARAPFELRRFEVLGTSGVAGVSALLAG
jgi:peptidoglycan/xylan/chitin deacetylase (PgdA/CDA1 family)